MKNIILLIAVMVIGACATTSTKPVKELTLREKVVGTYEVKVEEDTHRGVLLENGIFEVYENGKKEEKEGKWKISKEGELHVTRYDDVYVYRINKDGSVTQISYIPKDGKRKDIPKEGQDTLKKIK